MKVLLGTTNPSKINRFSHLLRNHHIDFITLNEIGVIEEPEEKGKTPEENARIKARFYGRFYNSVICSDSGLYFSKMDLCDERQPGLKIRTPMGGKRLSDEEMIDYYSSLINTLGGRVYAYYLDGIAVNKGGTVSSFMDKESAEKSSFIMVDKPSAKRFPGWPLDSLSINKDTGKYFVESKVEKTKENIIKGEYEMKIVSFLVKSLGII